MLQPNDILQERYQLVEQLSQNAWRQTWLAKDLQDSAKLVIIKLLTFSEQVDWNAIELFEREAAILRQLDHPRIPKYQDFFSIDDRLLWFGLVQDYIPGTSLKAALENGTRFTEEQIYQIASEILAILIYLHELNPPVLHRDIKPSNLIWGQERRIYLVDFGAAQDRPTAPGQSITVVGTYGYTPIEQFGGQTVPASDLYALAATLIHLLTNVCPSDLLKPNLKIQWRDRVRCTPAFAQWLETLLNPDSTQRFQTAREAQNMLAAVEKGSFRIKQQSSPSSCTINPDQQPSRIQRLEQAGIQVEKSPFALTLYIPRSMSGRGCLVLVINCSYLLALLILLVAVIPNSHAFMSILTLGMVGLWWINKRITKSSFTIMKFEGNEFTIRHFNRPDLPFKSVNIGDIQVVINATSVEENHYVYDLVIQTKSEKFIILKGSTWQEADWLGREIKAWIGN